MSVTLVVVRIRFKVWPASAATVSARQPWKGGGANAGGAISALTLHEQARPGVVEINPLTTSIDAAIAQWTART